MARDARLHQRLQALFDEAVRQDPSATHSVLGRADTDDPALREALRRLLEADRQANSPLDRPVTFTAPATLADEEFPGTERFTVLRRLGAGGMGVVYEARDRARGEVVAIETLPPRDGHTVYRLKQEFRSLAGVTHPNLVCLYELFVEDGRCFFTMELVEGVNFVAYVRGGPQSELSIDSLEASAAQLVQGLSAVHHLGKAASRHQAVDVLVTTSGRVVILDFGLITELFPDTLAGAEHVMGGTPEYVSPEEGSRTPPSEAGDWYARGRHVVRSIDRVRAVRRAADRGAVSQAPLDPPAPVDVAAVPARSERRVHGLSLPRSARGGCRGRRRSAGWVPSAGIVLHHASGGSGRSRRHSSDAGKS